MFRAMLNRNLARVRRVGRAAVMLFEIVRTFFCLAVSKEFEAILAELLAEEEAQTEEETRREDQKKGARARRGPTPFQPVPGGGYQE